MGRKQILQIANLKSCKLIIISIITLCITHNKIAKYIETMPNIYVTNYLPNCFINTSIVLVWNLKDTGGVGFGCVNESIDHGRSNYQDNINISQCFFSRYSHYSGSGGVIYVHGESYSMRANYSMFYYCVCSSEGGAIYFSSTDSNIKMICANRCSCGADYSGHFAYIRASQIGQVEYLSVSNCSQILSGYYPIRTNSGNQRADNTNSSLNRAFWGSGILIDSPSSFSGSHCTFSNNNVSSSVCIYFISTSDTISMINTNIVQNNSPDGWGIIVVNGGGSRKMMYMIFQSNENYLFYISGGSLEVSHSFIDHSSLLSYATAVSTTNNTFTNRMTYQIRFFDSLHCNADSPFIDASPILTIDQSPIRSLEKTIEESLKMSYERTIDQTIKETQNTTPYRSYAELICSNQIVNKREISVVFSFSFFFLFTK